MDTTFYETCANEGNSDENGMIECISLKVSTVHYNLVSAVKIFFIIYASSLVFFMQAGFAMICTGCVRRKNVQNTMMKNLLDSCGAALAFFSVGYALAFGGDSKGTTFIGNGNFFLIGMDNIGDYSTWLFQFAFAATAGTIVAGTIAERCQMNTYLLYSVFLTGFVYPVVAHWIWSKNGYLSYLLEEPLFGIGMIDLAGSGVVHVTGGLTAAIASKILGPRKGRFYDEQTGEILREAKSMPGHSKSLQMLGTFILWFSWFGFNAGSVVARPDDELKPRLVETAVINTALSAASSGVTALCVNLIITERRTGEAVYSLTYAMNGVISGLVAITGGCAIIEPWAAVIVGAVAGCNYLVGSNLLVRWRIDDAVDAIPVHLSNGIWGIVAVGLFASDRGICILLGITAAPHVGLFYAWSQGSSDASLLGCQVIGLIFIIVWVGFLMIPFFLALSYTGHLRSDGLEEIVGLDISYSNSIQNMIGDSDQVNPEVIEAYNERNRQSRHKGSYGNVDVFDNTMMTSDSVDHVE